MNNLPGYRMHIFFIDGAGNRLGATDVRSIPYIYYPPRARLMHMENSDRWAMIRCPSSQIVIPSNKEAVRSPFPSQWAFSPGAAYVTTRSVWLLGRE